MPTEGVKYMADEKPAGTRRSRKSGDYVVPQRSTEDAWYQTFALWSPEQQAVALKVLEQLARLRKTYLPAAAPTVRLPGVEKGGAE